MVRSPASTSRSGRIVAANRLWVVDRGSTNGTVIVRPDGTEVALAPGKRAKVQAGCVVRFGQRTIEVRSRSELDWPVPADPAD